jgi:hypothetical protein
LAGEERETNTALGGACGGAHNPAPNNPVPSNATAKRNIFIGD